ncbi:MAG: chorismate synthase [Alphaproteobacteria bacterium]|nr:chorismate synthase [Alphaproteobacteria bacterium]
MNTFGTLFRISIVGESHGLIVGVCIDGCPAGLPIDVEDFQIDLQRRKGGVQKGTTPRQEPDKPLIKTGVFNGHTTGAPIFIEFENTNTRSTDYAESIAIPRPGHADLTASIKYGGFNDYRGGGHFSGRLTVGLVAAGILAKKLMPNITVKATLLEIGGETNLELGLNKAIKEKDTIGGIVECMASGLPIGLGDHFFDSVESLISHLVFAIPAIKGIEFGSGFMAAKMFGSQHNDSFDNPLGASATNHAGGILGGLTTGQNLIFRVVVKPTSSTPKIQNSINLKTNQKEHFSIKGRHDLCIALRVPVVLEAVTAIVLADLMLINQNIPKIFKK